MGLLVPEGLPFRRFYNEKHFAFYAIMVRRTPLMITNGVPRWGGSRGPINIEPVAKSIPGTRARCGPGEERRSDRLNEHRSTACNAA